jgi:hypothetical protein
MFKVWSQFTHYLAFRQLALLALCLSGLSYGQAAPKARLVTRMPASYIPDDDVIVKPVNNELSFYQQYVAKDKSEEVINARNQIKIWNDNQQFAEQYGLDSSLAGSAFFVPSPEEKWEYFKDRYFRYLRRKGEQPFKEMPKNWYQEYRASNEVDTIDELEDKFQATNKNSTSGEALPDALQAKEVSVWKKTKFIFQPRLDQGLVIVGFKSPLAYARAWVGVNGKTEINIRQSFDSVGFRAMFNYEADTGKYFTSLDQRITDNISARVTSHRDPRNLVEDETLMLLYAKQF